MTFLYDLILWTYPRKFRHAYEREMRLAFRDLLHDPSVGRMMLAGIMLRDLANGLARPERLPSSVLAARSLIYGLIIVAFLIAAQLLQPGVYLGFPVPVIAFIFAAFWGARTTGTFAGGMWACVIIGVVSSTMVLWDKLFFGIFPFPDAWSLASGMLMAAGFCVVLGIIGSVAGTAVNRGRATRV
jgi:hypothetical protein